MHRINLEKNIVEVTLSLKGCGKGDIDLPLGITNSIPKSLTDVYFRTSIFFFYYYY